MDIDVENDWVTRGTADGIHEISIHQQGGNIHYIYFIVDEKYQ